MSNSDLLMQQRAVAKALLRSLDHAQPEVRLDVLRTIPVCTDDNVEEDFDHILASDGPADLLHARLAATDGNRVVFLRLLAGASARSVDAAAMSLLDSIPPGNRIKVSGRMVRLLARGFAASPTPSAALLDRMTNQDGPLEFIHHPHSHKTGMGGLLDAIATASISANSDRHLPLLVGNSRLCNHLFTSRQDFWSLVGAAAASLSDKSMASLAAAQDIVFASIPSHRLTTEDRDREQSVSNTIVQERIEILALASSNDKANGATGTLLELLKMDLPLDPTDQALGNRADWRILAALAPVQVPLGEQYMHLARPLMRSGSIDVIMDAMVFGSDQWWGECLAQVRREPSRLTDEMVKYVDFIEGELQSRIVTDGTKLTHAIDHLNKENPVRASVLADRLVNRVPVLAHITGSDADRQEWSSFMIDQIESSQPMTAAMFRSIAMGMTTNPSSEVSRAPLRM